MAQHSLRKTTIWNKDFILLLAVNVFTMISMHMQSTTIAKYALTLNNSSTLAGFIAGVFSVSSIVARPICGNLADRKSKKRLYILAMGIIFIGVFGYSVSNQIILLILFRLIHGIGWGFATTIGMTMASNTAPEGRVGESVSIYGLANVLAMAIAPNLGMFISQRYGYEWMFLADAAVVASAIILLMLIKDQHSPAECAASKFSFGSLVLKEALVLSVVLLLNGMAYTAVTTFLMVYCEGAGIKNPSTFFSVYSVAILVVRLLSGRIVDRKGPAYILVPGGFFFVGCLCLLGSLKSETALYLAAICLGLGYSATLSTLMAVAFMRTTKNKRGAASSTINIGMDIGTGLGSTAAGYLAGWFGYGTMYFLLCAPVILAVLLFVTDQKMFRARRGIYKAISDK